MTITDEARLAYEWRLAEDRDLAISLAELANAVLGMSYALADRMAQPFDGEAVKAQLARQTLAAGR
jgi:hypothetical protein